MKGEISFTVAADHPAFAGHFPGSPIVPGVLLLDAALHAVEQARQTADQTTGPAPAVYGQIASTKFLSPVRPGEALTISWASTDKGQIRFEIDGSGRRVASGIFDIGSAT